MTAELTDEMSNRLVADEFGWLTTIAKSGLPVPRLIWFHFDGSAIYLYTMPTAAKVAHIRRHPQVSLNLDSDGNGGGIVVIAGTAHVDAEDVDLRADRPYWAKYAATAERFGLTEAMEQYSTRIRIDIEKAWGTPVEG